jgi:hypothetical protein
MADEVLRGALDEVTITASRDEFKLYDVAATKNILHHFRSQTALFTISCVPASFLEADRTDLDKAIDNYVIAASGGKNRTTANLQDRADKLNKSVSQGQNLDKSSRFITSEDGIYLDFFIDDVEVETLADFNQQSGFSKATKLKFSIFIFTSICMRFQ